MKDEGKPTYPYPPSTDMEKIEKGDASPYLYPYPYPYPQKIKNSKHPYQYPYPYPEAKRQKYPGPHMFDPLKPGAYPYPMPKEFYPDHDWPRSTCFFAPGCPVKRDMSNLVDVGCCVHAFKFGCPLFFTQFDEFEEFSELNSVEIFEIGQPDTSHYTEEDLDKIVENFDELTKVHQPPIAVLGHDEDQSILRYSGLPSAGTVSKLWRSGKKLIANFSNVPRKIAELVNRGAYGKVSCEIYPDFLWDGRGWGKVLRRVAMLGFDIPKVKGLDSILVRYEESDQDSEWIDMFKEGVDYRRDGYQRGERVAMEKLDIKDPYRVHLAVERSYTEKPLDDLDKKILQAGWPHIHGELGTPFKDGKEEVEKKKYPYPYPYPHKYRYPYPKRYPYPRKSYSENLDISKEGLDLFERIYTKYITDSPVFHKFARCFSENMSLCDLRLNEIKKATGAEIEIVPCDAVDCYGRDADLFAEDEMVSQLSDEILTSYNEFLENEIYKEENEDESEAAKEWNTRVDRAKKDLKASMTDIDIALGRSQALWQGAGARRLTEKDKQILQAIWPEYYGALNTEFKFKGMFSEGSEWSPDDIQKLSGFFKIVKDAEDANEKLEFEIDTAEIVELYFDVTTGKKTMLSDRDKLILQTGWPDIFGKPDLDFIYPEPVEFPALSSGNQELETVQVTKLSEGEKMDKEKGKEEKKVPENTLTIEQFQEENAKLQEQIKKQGELLVTQDEALKAKDSEIGELKSQADKFSERLQTVEEERADEAHKNHLEDIAFFAESLKQKGMAPAVLDEGKMLPFMISLDWQTPIQFAEGEPQETVFERFTEVINELVEAHSEGRLFIPKGRMEKHEDNPPKKDATPSGIDESGFELNKEIQKYQEENKVSFEEAFEAVTKRDCKSKDVQF